MHISYLQKYTFMDDDDDAYDIDKLYLVPVCRSYMPLLSPHMSIITFGRPSSFKHPQITTWTVQLIHSDSHRQSDGRSIMNEDPLIFIVKYKQWHAHGGWMDLVKFTFNFYDCF